MRTVFDNSMVAHVWAQCSQEHGRSSNGHFYFSGRTIYSYGSHFPIATIVDVADGRRVVLVTTNTYSVTTTAHTYRAVDAVQHLDRFRVPSVTPTWNDWAPTHNLNRIWYVAQIEKAIAAVGKARLYKWRRSDSPSLACPDAAEIADAANAYCATFGLDPIAFDRDAYNAAVEARIAALQAKEVARQTPEAIAKRQRERARREAREAARIAEHGTIAVADFREGRPVHFSLRRDPCMLRVSASGEDVETSWGARFPVEHARRVWPVLSALRAAGRTYQRNGHTIHLGHFSLDRLDDQGTVYAGCHRVQWIEVERLARQLGLIRAEAATAA